MIIEAMILKYLQSAGIVGDKVYCEKPVTVKGSYILIQKTGSSEVNHIRQAMVAIQSISPDSLLTAAEVNGKVIETMKHMPDTEDIFSCKLNSDYNYTNTSTKEYRYQAVFDIKY